MTPQGLRRTQLTDEVATVLRNRIMTGDLRPGDFVRLDETASSLGCSVTPVREALVTLRGEGLVRSSPHRGFIVEPLERGDIVDIFWMQAELSARLATNAVGNPDLPAHLTTLSALVDEFEDAVAAGDQRRVLRTEFAFHREINLAGNSKKLAWFVHAASKYNPHELYTRDPEWRTQAAASHRRLVGYLHHRDTAAIRTEIHNGFEDARDRLIDKLESIGFFDDQSRAERAPA